MEKYDLIIVGAGPAGIFTAVELLRHGSKKKMLLVEKGKPVEKRHCPKAEVGHCVNCRPTCAITTGFSGAGAFSDGKLSLSYQVGGELPELIGEDFAQELINYTDKIYLEFGADPHVEGIYEGSEIKEIRKRAIQAGLQLVDCPIRHLGTEKAQDLYLAIENHLRERGVEYMFGHECSELLLDGGRCTGVRVNNSPDAPRSSLLGNALDVPHHAGPVLIAEARSPIAMASVVVALIVAPVHDCQIWRRITLPRLRRQLWQFRDDAADIVDLMKDVLVVSFIQQVIEDRARHDADVVLRELFAHDVDVERQIAVRAKLDGLVACLPCFIEHLLPRWQIRILDIVDAPAARCACDMDCHG